MKKKLLIIFIALFTAVCLFAGCGGDGPVREPVNPTPIEQETGDFTVTLVLNGAIYSPRGEVTATWDDGNSRPVTARFGSDGVARASGLDGDYIVRVQGLPEEFAFDTNGVIATNYNRKVRMDIYRATVLGSFRPNEQGDRIIYDAVELKMANSIDPNVGMAYRITLNSPLDIFYMYYKPRLAGMYSVKSLIDITENALNPKYQICSGTQHGARYTGATVDGGGPSSTYTANFDYHTGFNYDELQGILLFGVMAETRTLSFPLTFDILVKRTGDYVRQDIMSNVVLATEFDEIKNGQTTKAAFIARQDAFMRGPNNSTNYYKFYQKGTLDGTKIAFNEDTGYYHLYDGETGAYGAVICAKISQSCDLLDMPFNTIEDAGNKALTIDDNYDKFYKKETPKYGSDRDPHFLNYKVFIEGYGGISRKEDLFPGITEQYSEFKGEYGYAELCNTDGVYPVNKELKRFLQGYATNARMFMDGNGWAEMDGLMSAEEDQWLFACGYYVQ